MLRIITDSSSELSKEEAEALGIRVLPLTVVFGGRGYLEGEELTGDEFYKKLAEGEFPHTSQPSVEQFTEAFEGTRGEETLVILIASKLSGACNAARVAKEQGGFERVHIYDSRCVSAMLRLLAETAAANRERSAEEVIAILDELRPRIRLHACLNTLEYLRKGGRLKKSVAIVGDLLGIKPLIGIAPEGSVKMTGRARGQRRALKELADVFRAEALDPAYPVYFLQTDDEAPARALMRDLGREEDRLLRICGAVGAHIGPGAAGVVYVVK